MKLTSVEGRRGEDMAAEFLKKQGYRIVQRNFSCYVGEIDIIAYEKGVLVFIEVRHRNSTDFGHPFETVDSIKIKKIVRTAQSYMKFKELYDVSTRFDVVSVLGDKCELCKNAFEIN